MVEYQVETTYQLTKIKKIREKKCTCDWNIDFKREL